MLTPTASQPEFRRALRIDEKDDWALLASSENEDPIKNLQDSWHVVQVETPASEKDLDVPTSLLEYTIARYNLKINLTVGQPSGAGD